ncbi:MULTISPECIES: DUF6998 domain-containing protein [Microbacterium]|uniref:DUF6998 domain-containing protein n=1 Tax=Microbacterium TaxID=33882 RepID=UPI000F5E35E3|nr:MULTISPECIES: hypothetical protein [Microbacterium]AZH79154.1 hypothetical protein CSX12_12210 [Microbacterium sp. Y-01]MBM7464997.1 hypothetical protein [Microbacterium esteraromaticum]
MSNLNDSGTERVGLPDVTRLSVKHLLLLEASVVKELRRRDLVRTNNKPLGDIAEYVVWLARGGVLEPNSTKSHDITTESGHRIQVKAMANRAAGAGAKFSPFRSAGYHTAVFLLFNLEFEIAEAYEVEADLIEEHVRFVPHVAGRQPSLTQVRALGTDVTAEMQSAYARIDGAPLSD